MEKINIRVIALIANEMTRLIEVDNATFMKEAEYVNRHLNKYNEEAVRKIIEADHAIHNTPKSEYEVMSTPSRYRRANHYDGLKTMLGPNFCASLKLAAKHGMPLGLFMEAVAAVGDDHSKTVAKRFLMSDEYGAVNNGNMFASIFPLYQQYGEFSTMFMDADLMKELQMTDLSSSVPVHMLEMPYRHIYIQFGPVGPNSVLSDEYIVRNQETGDHRLEGCLLSFHNENYITHTEDAHKALGMPANADVRSFDVMFIGSPKDNMMDDSTHHMTVIYDHNSDQTLEEVLRRSIDYHINHQSFAQRPEYRRMKARDGENMRRNIDLLARCLVYMNCADCRRIDVDEVTPIRRQLDNVKNPKKRRRFEKQLQQADKYVLIKPVTKNENFSSGEASGRHVRAHWRRGHMRMQRYGENRAKTKLIHIRPQLIGANKIGSEPAKPTYKVK